MKNGLAVVLLFFSTVAVSQNSRYDSIALGPKGPIPGAKVAVCSQPANTNMQPCSPLASLCSSLTDATCTSPNPVTADALGNFHFYVTSAQSPFTIQVYGPQVAAPIVMPDQFPPFLGALILGNQNANQVFAGPTSGGATAPGFRALVGADLPAPSVSTLGGVESIAQTSHLWVDSVSNAGVPHQSQPAFSDLSGNISTSQMNSGTGANGSTFWRGDGTWALPPTVSGTITRYDSTWSHTTGASNVGTNITLQQADLVANAEWTMEANVAVADVGGTSPNIGTQFTLGGTSVTGCGIASTGSANNGATVKHRYLIRVKVLTTGVSGTAKVQCVASQSGGAASNTLIIASNSSDATTTINTTGNVLLTWTCSDSNGTATCHYYDSYTLKIN